MTGAERVKQGLKCHLHQSTGYTIDCENYPYNHNDDGMTTNMEECLTSLYEDASLLIDDMINTIKLLEV